MGAITPQEPMGFFIGTTGAGMTQKWSHHTYELRLWQHIQGLHRFKPEEGKCTSAPTSNQEAVCSWYPLAKENPAFSNGVSLGIIATLQGWLTQNELISIFVDFFSDFVLFRHSLPIIGLLLVYSCF